MSLCESRHEARNDTNIRIGNDIVITTRKNDEAFANYEKLNKELSTDKIESFNGNLDIV